MSKQSFSSGSSKNASSTADDKTLLKFYRKKFDEFQKKEDKYKEKVDRHLKDLINDRHELEEEVLRRGEKISDLQKALVELQLNIFEERSRFLKLSTENEELKRNEEQLHSNIRQLLAMTHEQELRDKIIYILKNPKVEIGYQSEIPTNSESRKVLSANKKLKDELDELKYHLDQALSVSKSQSDIILEDCQQALEKSKIKILQGESQIKELQKKLYNQEKSSLSATEGNEKTSFSTLKEPCEISEQSIGKSVSYESHFSNPVLSESYVGVCSQLKEIHLSLLLLQKLVSKVDNILNTIHATKLYQRLSKIPKAPTFMEIHVEENTIAQLESTLRQCTRLTYEINDRHQSIYKDLSGHKKRLQNINVLRSELKHLDGLIKEMTVATADNDLLNLELKRSDFFYALRDSSVSIPEEDRIRCLNNFKKIVSNNGALKKTVSRAADFLESVIQKYSAKRSDGSLEKNSRLVKSAAALLSMKEAKSQSMKDLESLHGIYKRTVEEAKNLGLDQSPDLKLMNDKLKVTEQQLQEEQLEKCDENFNAITKIDSSKNKLSESENLLRKIDKTLLKVKFMKEGKFTKDEKLCQQLATNVDELTKRFKEMTEEFSMKSVRDQFSEYSRVTLSKLEELATQCKNSVEAAEAQIAAYRSQSKQLSEKLKETEDLLRESINECLTLKKKVKNTEEQCEMEKYTLVSQLKEKLDNVSDHANVQNVLEDVMSYMEASKDTRMDPFVCTLCKEGMGHATCKEKIQELTAEERKSRTELKLLLREMKEEKENLRYHREVAEHTVNELNKVNQQLTKKIASLESKNCSLLEEQKVLKNRLKRMEQFRQLEVEGFQTDTKHLKAKIQEMEKNLKKAVCIFENDKKDVELLNSIHESAYHSKQAALALRKLKAKLYELENDLKNL